MGTPRFAVPVLERLAGEHEVVAVVTQPDRPGGRGQQPAPPAVKRSAERLGLTVYQPETLRAAAAQAQLAQWQPEVVVVAAFGLIVPQAMLDVPPLGCVNVHASLLPRWRGAAPIAAAILAGDGLSGVTIMRMDAGVDTGAVLAQRTEAVRSDDTQESLAARLSALGAGLLGDVLPAYGRGELEARPQPEAGVTYAPHMTKEDGRLDWSRPAVELDRQVRALSPWPGTYTHWRNARLKVLKAQALPDWSGNACPGTVVMVARRPAVATGAGALLMENLQIAGKRPMDGMAFVRGQRDFINSQLDAGAGGA
jgi:methionyl-tRNA formyltransferase